MKAIVLTARRLSVFLIVSLGVHLILLLGFGADHRLIPLRISSAPLMATLASPGRQAATQPPAKESRWPKQLRPPKQANIATKEAANLVRAETGVRAAVVTSVSRDLDRAGSVSNSTSGEGASPSAPQEGASIDAVRQYVLRLVPEVRRFKRYPAIARERGWEGRVEVTVSLGTIKAVPAIALARSSGFTVLDEQALSMIGQAVQLVAVPEVLRGKDIAIPLPILFSLDD